MFYRIPGLLVIAVLAWSAVSCGADDAAVNGEIPVPRVMLPPALSTTAAPSAQSRAAVPDAEGVFEPFRSSLAVAAQTLQAVYEVIDKINDTVVPDTLDTIGAGGNRIVIDIDEERTYKKRIRFFKDGTATEPFLIVLYNKGEVKGQLYYFDANTVAPKTADGTLLALAVDYDETITDPVLELSLDLRDGETTNTHPRSLYYKGVYTATNTQVAGGLGYRYVFNTDNGVKSYEGDHVYMYRAVTSPSGTAARAQLFFSDADAISVDESDDALGTVFLGIVREWVNYTENSAIRTAIDLATPSITYDDTDEKFRTDLIAWKAAHSNPNNLDALLFVLDLANDIAYSATAGYVAHGTNAALQPGGDYSTTAIGDPSLIAWPKTPAAVFTLVVSAP